MSTSRNPKWRAPAPLPAASTASAPPMPLHALFDQEQRRPTPLEDDDQLRLQVDVLRAECNYLRMERDVAVGRLRRHRARTSLALRSALDSVSSGRNRAEGAAGEVLRELQGKLEAGSCREGVHHQRRRSSSGGGGNFDRKALVLRRRLQEMNVREMMPRGAGERRWEELEEEDEEEEEEVSVREIREIAAETTAAAASARMMGSSMAATAAAAALPEVEILRRKMDCISKGMLERVEEYGSMILLSPSSLGDTMNSKEHNDRPNLGKTVTTAEEQLQEQERTCGGRCREVVERVAEQVRAETEQWAEMQGMLEQVRKEMEDLRCGRDFWERCALRSDHKLRSANIQMMQWRRKAREAESRAAELQKLVVVLQDELADAKREAAIFRPPPSSASVVVKSRSDANCDSRTMELLKEKEEKHVLFRRFLDENFMRPKPVSSGRRQRTALREIGNI